MKKHLRMRHGLLAAGFLALALMLLPAVPAQAQTVETGDDYIIEVVPKSEVPEGDWTVVSEDDLKLSCDESITADEGDETLDASGTTASGWIYGDHLTGMTKTIYNACKNITPTDYVVKITKKYKNSDEMSDIISGMQEGYLPGLFAYKCDYPEKMDWSTDNLTFSWDSTGSSIVCYCNYIRSKYYTTTLHNKMISSADTLAKKVKAYSSDEKKQLKYLHDWIAENNVYDYDSNSEEDYSKQRYYSHSPYGCLFKGKGVCASYTQTFKLVCDRLGIPCIFVRGDNHSWDYVQLQDGKWYMVDCTWDDSDPDELSYQYFLCGNRPNLEGHEEDGLFPRPTTIWNLNSPKITSLTNTSKGVKVTWSEVDKYNGYEVFEYAVYRKTGSGSWTKLKETWEPSRTYVDTTAKSGTSYTYCAVAMDVCGDSWTVQRLSALGVNTKTITRLDPISSSDLKLTNWKAGVKVTWKKITGATGYNIYRKTSGGSYEKIASTDSNTAVEYLDRTAENGVTYTYAVRAVKGSTLSGYSGRSVIRLATPTMTSLVNDAQLTMVARWKANTAAKSYELRYAEDSAFTKNVKTLTMTSSSTLRKTVTGLTKGKTYYVKVRAYAKSGTTKYVSGWSSVMSVKITQ